MTDYIKSGVACEEARIPQHKLNGYGAECPWLPTVPGNGKTRPFSVHIDAPLLCFFGDLIEDYTIRHASKIVARVKQGMEEHPAVDQLTIVSLANGATSVHPTNDLDLSTGFVSGGFVRTAMIVDVRNYRERVLRAIAAAPVVTGGDDD